MNFIFSQMNLLITDDGQIAILHEDIKVNKLVIRYFGKLALDFILIIFENFVLDELACVKSYTEIACEG